MEKLGKSRSVQPRPFHLQTYVSQGQACLGPHLLILSASWMLATSDTGTQFAQVVVDCQTVTGSLWGNLGQLTLGQGW